MKYKVIKSVTTKYWSIQKQGKEWPSASNVGNGNLEISPQFLSPVSSRHNRKQL